MNKCFAYIAFKLVVYQFSPVLLSSEHFPYAGRLYAMDTLFHLISTTIP